MSTSDSSWRRALDATAHLIVLLGGEAGLRCGEMIALEWRDVDLGQRQICVQRSDWNGYGIDLFATQEGNRSSLVALGGDRQNATTAIGVGRFADRHVPDEGVDSGEPDIARQWIEQLNWR